MRRRKNDGKLQYQLCKSSIQVNVRNSYRYIYVKSDVLLCRDLNLYKQGHCKVVALSATKDEYRAKV